MPLRLNVGVTQEARPAVLLQRRGQLPHRAGPRARAGLLESDLDGFHRQVRAAYVAAHQAVNDELARLRAAATADGPSRSRASRPTVARPSRPTGTAGPVAAPPIGRPGRPATPTRSGRSSDRPPAAGRPGRPALRPRRRPARGPVAGRGRRLIDQLKAAGTA